MVKHPAVSLSSQKDPDSNAVGVSRREYVTKKLHKRFDRKNVNLDYCVNLML
ncbi:MAG: hypothetical protein LBU04_05910 [Christensenellaceae bacterium]|nr:hypothetical protein [Christensenellaceae bacterium]